jgi:hypothetical protein
MPPQWQRCASAHAITAHPPFVFIRLLLSCITNERHNLRFDIFAFVEIFCVVQDSELTNATNDSKAKDDEITMKFGKSIER